MDRTGSCISISRTRGRAMLLLSALLPLLWGVSVATDPPVLRMLHVVETQEALGVANDAGLAFPPGVNGLLILDESPPAGRLQLLGDPDADYGKLLRHGIEAPRKDQTGKPGRDILVLAADRRTLILNFSAGSAVDQIRVLVEADRGSFGD